MKTNILYLFLISVAFFSCKTQSDIAYFQDLENKYDQGIAIDTLLNYESKIIPDDILSIYVSAEDPNAVAIFNLPAVSYLYTGQTDITATPKLQTYLVDKNGNINYPQLGQLHVAGLTRKQLESLIKNKIENYVKEPLVTVDILNFNIGRNKQTRYHQYIRRPHINFRCNRYGRRLIYIRKKRKYIINQRK